MKNIFKTGLAGLVFAMMVVVSASAKDLPIKILPSGEKSVNVYFGEIEGKVSFSIADQSGIVLHSKWLKDKKSYTVQLDFRELPDGTYTIEFVGHDKKEKVNLVLIDGKLVVGRAIANL